MGEDRLKLPKGYISHSQISTWKWSRNQYIDKYVFGIDTPSSPQLLYGKKIANWLETGIWNDAPEETKKVLDRLTRYPFMEQELKATLPTPKGSFDIVGYMDSFHPKKLLVREYKTGVKPWDQDRANKHLQTMIYAGLIYRENGILPTVHIDWIPTKLVDGEVFPTGEIFTFKVDVTVQKVMQGLQQAQLAALEIHEWYSAYEKTAADLLATV